MDTKLKLSDQLVEKLSNLPESGMGYQIVDVKLKSGQLLKNRIVINSEYLKVDEDERLKSEDIEDILSVDRY